MSDSIKNVFPANLKTLRLQLGKTQAEMAHLLGITRGRLANYETGKRLPDTNTLNLISDRAGVTVEFLLRGGPRFKTTLNEEELRSYTRANERLKKYGDFLNLNEVNVASRIAITEFFNYLKEKEDNEKTPDTNDYND